MLPLLARFPALAAIPRVGLGTFPSPVERVALAGGGALWVKRDDLDAPAMGGNKVRALEFLLGRVRDGDTVLTLGGEGSTHVLATAHHAARLGACTRAIRWRHEMHDGARDVAARARSLCLDVRTVRTAPGALLLAAWLRLQARRHGEIVHWIPIGGSAPLGVLGHVNAALELATQVAAGALPRPARIVVPLGSGGTTAGLALGMAIAGLHVPIVGVRVAPRIASGARVVRRLARATAALIKQHTGAPVPALRPDAVQVAHAWYGGAYARPLAAGTAAARFFAQAPGLALDATYSAKAAAAALALAGSAPGETLLWITYDGRATMHTTSGDAA